MTMTDTKDASANTDSQPSWAQRAPTTIIEPVEGDKTYTQRAIGEAIEEYIADEQDLDHDPNCHYDCVSPDGSAHVQVKAASWRVCNGVQNGSQMYAHGRFRLYEMDHQWLKENNGLYAFVVYEEHSMGVIPLYVRLVYPEFIDGILGANPWYDLNKPLEDKAEGSDLRLAWPRVFPGTGAEL